MIVARLAGLGAGTPLNIEYLVVAGGAGGAYLSGGGGAGGYRTATAEFTPGTSYTVTVGAGGTATTIAHARAGNGGDSQFATISSTGGGDGGYEDGTAGSGPDGDTGGSGGGAPHGDGASYGAGNAGSYSPVEGYRGGEATFVRMYNGGCGGGGGSSAVGANQVAGVSGGAGGAGTANSITGTSVTYAIGGSGAYNVPTNDGGGGANGNGGGTSSNGLTQGEAGNANTGNGAGGTWNGTPNGTSTGGSGIVVLKVPAVYTATFSGGVTYTTITSVSGYNIYRVTAAGPTDTVSFN